MEGGHKEGATGQRVGTYTGEMTTLSQEETQGGDFYTHTHTHSLN